MDNYTKETEMWKDVQGYEGLYKINANGEIWRVNKNKPLKPHRCQGYLRVSLYDGGKQRKFYVHRLVAFSFLDEPSNKDRNEINHKDGNKKNNHFSNLEWVTSKENIDHAIHMGLRGGRGICNLGELTEKDMEIIKYLHTSNFLSYSAYLIILFARLIKNNKNPNRLWLGFFLLLR